MKFIKFATLTSIENAIMDFSLCFEHLTEKVEDIHNYCVKLFNNIKVYILDNNGIQMGISVFYTHYSKYILVKY